MKYTRKEAQLWIEMVHVLVGRGGSMTMDLAIVEADKFIVAYRGHVIRFKEDPLAMRLIQYCPQLATRASEVMAAARAAVAQHPNQKIVAIKVVREMTHIGLKEAKDAVELLGM